MATTYFFQNEVFTNFILPFLLAFTLVFAILEKSKLLGEGKKQINAIVAFVVGLILISFANYVQVITQLMAFMAISLVILFVFLLLFGFAYGDTSGSPLTDNMKKGLGVIVAIAVVIAVLVFTGYGQEAWDYLQDNQDAMTNIIFAVIVIAAVAVIFFSGKKEMGLPG